MKSILFAAALVLSFIHPVWSQEFSTIESKDGILFQSIQSFPVGDSLLIFFSTSGKKNFNAIVVLPDGSQKVLELTELKEKAIATITSSNDDLHFHYFDENKESVTINVLSLSKLTMRKTVQNSVAIPGKIIGYEANDSLTLVTYDEHSSMIHVQRFKNFKQTFSNKYPVNGQLFKAKVTFISQTNIIQPSDADADIKMYLQGKFLWILAENHDNKSMGTSTVFRIDISTGTTATTAIFDFSGNKWNTMLCGETILKVVKSSGIMLEAYDFPKKDPVFSVHFKEGSAISKSPAYERRGVSNEVFSVDVQQSLKAWGRPVVIAYPRNGNSILLKVGNYEPKLNPKSPVPVIGSGVLKLIFETAKVGSYAYNDKISDDRYFYLEGNFNDGFTLESIQKF